MNYETIFRSMYNQLITAGVSQEKAYSVASEQAAKTVVILRDKGDIVPELV